MVVGAVAERTEVVVIGAGPGGYAAALRAADAGFETVLVERDQLGGTCLNVGCIPSKDLIESAALFHSAQHRVGLSVTGAPDPAAMADQRAKVIGGLREGVASLLNDAGVRVVSGTAHFSRHDRLAIAHAESVWHLEFDHAIVATGSRPLGLPAFPVGGRIHNSTGALALATVPESLAVIGAGYIGVELGTAFAKLGTAVHLVESGPRVLPEVPASLARPVQQRLADLGVTLYLSAVADQPTPDGLRLADGRELVADEILVAVGRVPNADSCSIEAAGAALLPSGHVSVDERLRAAPQVYAIGDATEGPALAHRAINDAERVVADISGAALPAPAAIPAVIFGDPEVMMVGASPERGDEAGIHVHQFPHVASARAHTTQSVSGTTLVVTDDAQTVIGVHAVGPHASELAGEAALAIEMAATVDDLAATVHPHPTMSETLAEAAHVAAGMPLHIRRR